eukprot:1087629-Rhodomonas_salina.1
MCLNDLCFPQHENIVTNDIFNSVRFWALSHKEDTLERSWKSWIEHIHDQAPGKRLTFKILLDEAEEQEQLVKSMKSEVSDQKLSSFSAYEPTAMFMRYNSRQNSRSPQRGRSFSPRRRS